MSINNRSDFINAASSDKIILAHIHANKRVINWTLHSGSIYKRTLPYFVNDVKLETTSLTKVSDLGSVVAGTFFYDIPTSTVYIRLTDSSNPVNSEMIIQYRLFFANQSLSNAWDLGLTDNHVYYDGRIIGSPEYNHSIGIEQSLSSIVGTGNLKLQNIDGELDDIYDSLIFENQEIFIYNWNKNIPIDESQIIYRGRITNKFYDNNSVGFKVKDQIYNILQTLPQDAFTEADNVNESINGNIKRWIYGRVDGLKLQSVDQIGNGVQLTGTISGFVDSTSLTGTLTSFLSELSPGDKITVRTLELEVESVQTDTIATLSGIPDYGFSNEAVALVSPYTPVNTKNREFFVAGHACAKLTKTVSNVVQLNRVTLNDTSGLKSGDFIEFDDTSERIEIKTVAPGNIIVLRHNMITLPTIGTDVIRQPIQKVYIKGTQVPSSSFTISNSSTETKLTLDSTIEFDIASSKEISNDLIFTNGSKTITTTDVIDLTTIFKSRDWIRPSDGTYTTFYEILNVNALSLTLRTTFSDPTITDTATQKQPDYIGDDTIISADVLGRTEDNTPSGNWLITGSDVVKDILGVINITNINDQSFIDSALDSNHLVSMAVPFNPTSTLTTAKTVIDRISKSILGSLTLDNSLDMKYKVLLVESSESLITINDSDIIDFKIKSSNGKTYRNSIVHHRHQDVINTTLESGFLVATHESDFVNKYIGTNDTHTLDVYLYDTQSAETISHRDIYYNQLARSTITVTSDLRLENLVIGDSIILNFARLYKRYGDSSSRKKLAYVIGKKVTGKQITFIMSDLSNTFNQSCIIAQNTTSDYSSASEDEKLKYGYITDSNGIVDSDEDTSNTNLIT